MTTGEFLSTIGARDATLAPAAAAADISRANMILQSMRCAMMPSALLDFYQQCGGIVRGTAYIFGPMQIPRTPIYPIPSIIDINKEMSTLPAAAGKTIFARNDLFLFAFDAFGTFFMLDNLNLRVLRKYDNMIGAMTDCLAAGTV